MSYPEIKQINELFESISNKFKSWLLEKKPEWETYMARTHYPHHTFGCIMEEINKYIQEHIDPNNKFLNHQRNNAIYDIPFYPFDGPLYNKLGVPIFTYQLPTVHVKETMPSYLNKYTLKNVETHDNPYLPFSKYVYLTDLYCYRGERLLLWDYEDKFKNEPMPYIKPLNSQNGWYEITDNMTVRFICDLQINPYQCGDDIRELRDLCRQGKIIYLEYPDKPT